MKPNRSRLPPSTAAYNPQAPPSAVCENVSSECTRNGRLATQPRGCGRVPPVVRITIIPAAYAAIKPSLAKGANEPPPQRDAAGRFVIYVEETYGDRLKELRDPGRITAMSS